MIEAPTQKLYYNRFLYNIKFKITEDYKNSTGVRNNSLLREIKKYIKDHCSASRSRIDWHVGGARGNQYFDITLSIFFNESTIYDDLCSKYNSIISWASKPLNDKHKELLQHKVEIIFRDKLLYNRFRYKIGMKVGWRKEHLEEIKSWLDNQFEGRICSRKGDYFFAGSWVWTLYLIDDADLMLVKLSLSEYINHVVRVERLIDYGITS